MPNKLETSWYKKFKPSSTEGGFRFRTIFLNIFEHSRKERGNLMQGALSTNKFFLEKILSTVEASRLAQVRRLISVVQDCRRCANLNPASIICLSGLPECQIKQALWGQENWLEILCVLAEISGSASANGNGRKAWVMRRKKGKKLLAPKKRRKRSNRFPGNLPSDLRARVLRRVKHPFIPVILESQTSWGIRQAVTTALSATRRCFHEEWNISSGNSSGSQFKLIF